MRVLVVLFVCLGLALENVDCAMSEKQMKAALRLVRNVCQPKFKATDEQIEGMHKGMWDQDKPGKCYLWCILNSYKLMTKQNEFDWEGGITTINNQAPESIRRGAVVSVKNCKDAIKTQSDKCEAGYEVAHCIYLDNPENYFFP